jgi:tight adherence protein B
MLTIILFAAPALVIVAVLLLLTGMRDLRSGDDTASRLDRRALAAQEEAAKIAAQQANSGKRVFKQSGGKQSRSPVTDMLARNKALAQFNKAMERRAFGADIARNLARADLQIKPSEYLFIRIGSVAGLAALAVILGMVLPTIGSPIGVAGFMLAGFMLPGLYIGRRQGARLNAFNDMLPDTVTLLSNGLRAGASFLQAMDLVVREARAPISTEFSRVIREVNLGLPLEQALNNLVRRVRSDDLELMVTAITIQYSVGGNLAEILDSIAFTIRERVRIKGEIRSLTAQQRMTGYLLGAMPIIIAILLSVIAPKFLAPMFDPTVAVAHIPVGLIMFGFCGLTMGVGFLIIRKIVNIKV